MIQTGIKQSKRGGKRVGAGRPPSGTKPIAVQVTEAKQLAIQSVVQQFRAELEERLLKNVRNLGKLADGLTKEEAEAFGALPDRYANIYLIDRLVGKPADPSKEQAPVTNNTLALIGYTVEQLRALLGATSSAVLGQKG